MVKDYFSKSLNILMIKHYFKIHLDFLSDMNNVKQLIIVKGGSILKEFKIKHSFHKLRPKSNLMKFALFL